MFGFKPFLGRCVSCGVATGVLTVSHNAKSVKQRHAGIRFTSATSQIALLRTYESNRVPDHESRATATAD